MRKPTVRVFVVGMIAAGASAAAIADGAGRRYCADSMVRGTYAIQMQGTQVQPDGSIANVIGVVVRYYDGRNGVTQLDNVKNSATGYVPDRYGAGTYQVNDNCTVDITFHPAPNVTIQERAVIVDEGRELRSITVLPAGLFVTAVAQRI